MSVAETARNALLQTAPVHLVSFRTAAALRRRVGGPRAVVTALNAVLDQAALAAAVGLAGFAFGSPGALAFAGLPVFAVALTSLGLYEPKRTASASREAKRLAAAVACVTAVTGLFVVPGAPRPWVLAVAISTYGTALGVRLGLRRAVRDLETTGTVVVGTSDEARALARALHRGRWSGYRAAGFVQTGRGNVIGAVDGLPILGSVDDLPQVVRHARAGAVVVTSADLGPHTLARVHRMLDGLGVEAFATPAPTSLPTWRVDVEALDGKALVAVRTADRRPAHSSAKRALDVVGSAALLLLSAPLFAIFAAAIKLTSPGPVLFRQKRVGEDGIPFVLYKFRTMVHDAEDRLAGLRDRNEAHGHLFKIRDDPRVTRVGGLLRRWSLDELPQLWNVLRGDMSLVGPRPALPDETEKYEGPLRGRLAVKPGLTGLWQVNGRQKLGFEDYSHYDLFYAENWSFWLDLTILARTIPAVLSREGAW